MKREIAGEKTIWIDFENPTEKELQALTQRYQIHPLVINELRRPTFRPKVENYGDFLYMILHFPVYNAEDSNHGHEVDFVIGKDFLITAHYQVIPALKEFSKNKKHVSSSSGNLLYDMLSNLFASSLVGLEIIDKNISHMEEAVFHEPGREFIERISVLRREILDFRRAIQPQESVLISLADHGKKFFGKDMAPYLDKVIGDYLRVWHILENHKEMVEALHQTN